MPPIAFTPVYAPGQSAAPLVAPAANPPWQFGLIAFALFALGDPFINLNKINGGEDPAPWIRYVWLTLYIILTPLFVAQWRALPGGLARAPILAALGLLAMASAAWSILPDVTLRRAVGVLVWLAFAIIVAQRLSWREIIRAAAWGFLWLAAISVVLALVWPQHGIMDVEHPGAWSGAWTHKNQLGGHMAMAVATFAAAALIDPQRRMMWGAGLALALGLVVLSTSATALLSSALALGLFAFVLFVRRGPIVAVLSVAAIAIVSLLIGGVLLLAPELAFNAIGRDATLTGRTDIWSYLFRAIEQRPALGYGYGAFWEDDTGPVWWVRAGVGWKAPSAHNGWIELALGLGIVGGGLFALSAVMTSVRVIGAIAHPHACVFAPGILALFFIQTAGEGYVLEDNNLMWALYLIVAIKLAVGEPVATDSRDEG
jgi:O-antigen ligase